MAVSGKYGDVNIPGIGANEPVFILRAQDKLAEPTVEMYRLLASSHGSALAGSVCEAIDSFKKWSGNRKLPD